MAQFDLYSSTPLNYDDLKNAIKFKETGTETWDDGAYHGPVLVKLDQLSPQQYRVYASRSSTGTITPYVAANVLTNTSQPELGTGNYESNTTPAPPNFVGYLGTKLNPQIIPGDQVPHTVHYTVPLILNGDAPDTTLREGEPSKKVVTLSLADTREVNGHPQVVKAPIGSITLSLLAQGDATPDPLVNPLDAPQAVADLVELVSTGADSLNNKPVIRSYERDVAIHLNPKDNTIVDGSRTIHYSFGVHSDDPEFDGLYVNLPKFTATIEDNDQPSTHSTAAMVTNEQPADGTSEDVAAMTVRNNGVTAYPDAHPAIEAATPQTVSNAKVELTIPRVLGMTVTYVDATGTHTVNAGDAVVGTGTDGRVVTAITPASGEISIKATSTTAGTFPIAYSMVRADSSEPNAEPVSGTLAFIFAALPVDQASSDYTVSTGDRVAGSQTHTVTVVLKDELKRAVTGIADKLTPASSNPDITVGAFQEQPSAPGTYVARISATQPGSATITVTATGAGKDGADVVIPLKQGGNAIATFIEGPKVTPEKSSFEVGETPAVADGTATVPVTVHLGDQTGAGIEGSANIIVPKQLRLTSDQCSAAPSTGDTFTYTCDSAADGSITAQLTTTVAGDYVVKVTVPNGTAEGAELTATDGKNTAHFVAGEPDLETKSSFKVSSGAVQVGGAHTLTVTLRDANGNPVKGAVAKLAASLTGLDGATVGTLTETAAGIYTAKITSEKAGTATAAVTYKGTAVKVDKNDKAVFVAGPFHPGSSELVVKNTATDAVVDTVAAGTGVTILFTPKDEYGNPTAVTAASPATLVVVVPGTEDDVTLTRQDNGTYTGTATPVIATSKGTVVTFRADSPAAGVSTPLQIVPNVPSFVKAPNAPAGAQVSQATVVSPVEVGTPSNVTITRLADAYGNVVTAQDSDITATVNGTAATVTAAAGTYKVDVPTDKAGTIPVQFSYKGDLLGPVFNVEVMEKVTGVVDPKASYFTVTEGNKIADGHDAHTVTVTLVDKAGNPLPGQKVEISEPENLMVSKVKDNGDGTYTAELTTTVAGAYPITVSVGGVNILAKGNDTAHFVAGPASSTLSTISFDPAEPIYGDTVKVTVTLQDDFGNFLTEGTAVEITVEDGDTINGVVGEKGVVYLADGTTLPSFVTPKIGDVKVTALVDGKEAISGVVPVGWPTPKAPTITVDYNKDGSAVVSVTPAAGVGNDGEATLTVGGKTVKVEGPDKDGVSTYVVPKADRLNGELALTATITNGGGKVSPEATGTVKVWEENTPEPTPSPTDTGEPAKPLPSTGVSGGVTTLGIVGALLVVGGVLLVVATRRRKEQE